MLAGIREILVISTPRDLFTFQRLLGDGTRWGLSFLYAVQPCSHGGIAEAFIIAKDFIAGQPCCLILGDNIFHRPNLDQVLRYVVARNTGATILAIPVPNPQDYTVPEFDNYGVVIGFEKKPRAPKSMYAVMGIYIYDSQVTDVAFRLEPNTPGGELAITDVNSWYFKNNQLKTILMDNTTTWIDAGAGPGSLLQAIIFVATVENQQGTKVGCLEEIAYRLGYINVDQQVSIVAQVGSTTYGKYLLRVFGGEGW